MEYDKMLDKISKCLGQLLGALVTLEKVDLLLGLILTAGS